MGRYLKISAVTSLVFYLIINSFLRLYINNYEISDGIVHKSNNIFLNGSLILLVLLMIATFVGMWFYNKIGNKNGVIKVILFAYILPISIVANIVTVVYTVVLVANIPYLNIKDEYSLKKPLIINENVKNAEKISRLSYKIKSDLKENKEIYTDNKDSEYKGYNTIKSIDELYDFIEKNSISQSMSSDSYMKQSIYSDIFTIQKYELKLINKELSNGKKEAAIKRYIRLWDINRKILNTREKSHLMEVMTEASISRVIDFYFENYNAIGTEPLKNIEFDKIKSEMKLSFIDSCSFEFYDMNRIIDPLDIPFILKPFINKTVSKKLVEERYLSVIAKYDSKDAKIKTKYEDNFEKNILAAPISGVLMRIAKPDMRNYMMKNIEARTKLDIIKYVINSKGTPSKEGMPISYLTGSKINLEQIESSGKVEYIIKLNEEFQKVGEKPTEYRF